MRLLNSVAIAVIALPLAAISTSAMAATAYNSQAGGFGASSNAGDSTVNSRHMKHLGTQEMM